MPRRDQRTSELDEGFEEYIGPGFISHGWYEEVLWPAPPWQLARPIVETVVVEAAPARDGRGRLAGGGPCRYLRADDRIAEDINEALTWHPDVDASAIEVAVRDGVVTLAGMVPDRAMHRRIAALALQIPGVGEVRDELRVARGRTP